MVVIAVQNFTDAEIHTLTVENRELFCVKMIDLQKQLGIKNKDFRKKKKKKYLRTEQEISKKTYS